MNAIAKYPHIFNFLGLLIWFKDDRSTPITCQNDMAMTNEHKVVAETNIAIGLKVSRVSKNLSYKIEIINITNKVPQETIQYEIGRDTSPFQYLLKKLFLTNFDCLVSAIEGSSSIWEYSESDVIFPKTGLSTPE